MAEQKMIYRGSGYYGRADRLSHKLGKSPITIVPDRLTFFILMFQICSLKVLHFYKCNICACIKLQIR